MILTRFKSKAQARGENHTDLHLLPQIKTKLHAIRTGVQLQNNLATNGNQSWKILNATGVSQPRQTEV
jgi:hypothetical protein